MNKGTNLQLLMMDTNAIRKSNDIVGAAKNLDLNCLDEGKRVHTHICLDKNVEISFSYVLH